MKILCGECREIAKELSMVLVKYHIRSVWNKKIYLILQNDFQLYNLYAFPKAILYECWRSCKLEHLSSSLAYSMSADLFLLHYFIRSILYWLCNAFICGETKVLRFLLSGKIYLSIFLSICQSILYNKDVYFIYIYIYRQV